MSPQLVNGRILMEIPMDSSEVAATIFNALRPETDSSPSDRAHVNLSISESTLIIEVSASDLTALRAATNSYLSWISACRRTMEMQKGQNP